MILLLLGLFGLIGGVGITAIGPGGVLPTIGLVVLTDLTPSEVAGTAIVTHIATGVLGTAAYTRSGQLRDSRTRHTAAVLAGSACVGTPIGVLINAAVSARVFGVALAVVMVVVAGLVWHRDRRPAAPSDTHPPVVVVGLIGLAVAVAAGIIGIGGPMLTVPLLVIVGVPVLESLAAAQAQSIVIATVGSAGYLAQGSIDWVLAGVIGIPELAGVLIGWRIAHALPARQLARGLILALVVVAPYIALG